jgi:hypothetical protein
MEPQLSGASREWLSGQLHEVLDKWPWCLDDEINRSQLLELHRLHQPRRKLGAMLDLRRRRLERRSDRLCPAPQALCKEVLGDGFRMRATALRGRSVM